MAKSANQRKSNNFSRRNTGELVLAAIKKLVRNTGWTARTIVKFIKMEYRITDRNISRKVSRALKRGVTLGLLQFDRGRYRLNDISRFARPVESKEFRLHTRPVQRRVQRHRAPKLQLRIRSQQNLHRK